MLVECPEKPQAKPSLSLEEKMEKWRAYYHKNADSKRARAIAYYQANKEIVLAKVKVKRANLTVQDRERMRAWQRNYYERNKLELSSDTERREARRIRAKTYYYKMTDKSNPDYEKFKAVRRARAKARYEKNKDKIKAKAKEWREKHPTYLRDYRIKNRDRLLSQERAKRRKRPGRHTTARYGGHHGKSNEAKLVEIKALGCICPGCGENLSFASDAVLKTFFVFSHIHSRKCLAYVEKEGKDYFWACHSCNNVQGARCGRWTSPGVFEEIEACKHNKS